MFESTLPTLTSVNVLVTSVLSNFICDACVGDDITAAAHREITEHVEALHRYSCSHPSTSIVVAPPLPRSDPDWFLAYLPGFTSFLYHEVSRMCNSNLKFMTPFAAPSSFFERDGVHLNHEAGVTFVQNLITGCDLLYPSVLDPASSSSTTSTPAEFVTLSQSVDVLRSDFLRRRLQDNLIFARIKEDRDHEINKAREDRCTISGLVVASAPPQDPKERKEFFKGLIKNLISEACPEAEAPPVVLDVIVNMRFGRGPPFFKVKLDSVASSAIFPIAASKLAKDGKGSFSGLFISNTVNLSTRIRIDIMKLISKRLTTPTEVAYVQGFSSRPTLHYRMKESTVGSVIAAPSPSTPGTGRSYTFVEVVERWGDLLSAASLEPIRRKAYQAFRGCLEQYFVVLSDQSASDEEDSMFSRLTSGRGRSSIGRRSRPAGRRGSNYTRIGVLGNQHSRSQSHSIPQFGGAGCSTSQSDVLDRPGLKRSLVPDAAADEGTPVKKKADCPE